MVFQKSILLYQVSSQETKMEEYELEQNKKFQKLEDIMILYAHECYKTENHHDTKEKLMYFQIIKKLVNDCDDKNSLEKFLYKRMNDWVTIKDAAHDSKDHVVFVKDYGKVTSKYAFYQFYSNSVVWNYLRDEVMKNDSSNIQDKKKQYDIGYGETTFNDAIK